MIRLIVRSQTPEEAELEVHGWVSGKHVEILEQEGTRLLEEAQRLVLNLGGLEFIDEDGIRLLQRWSGKHLELRNGSWFIQLLLGQHGLVQTQELSG